jgi:hypothetical protein
MADCLDLQLDPHCGVLGAAELPHRLATMHAAIHNRL